MREARQRTLSSVGTGHKVRRFLSLLVLGLLFCRAAEGQVIAANPWYTSLNAPVSYVGPGDLVSGTTAFYSLRAYSAAVAATGTQSAVDLRRPGDNATCTPKIGTNGSIDLTVGTPCNSSTQTVTSWLGSAATCTGAIGPASTTITVTSCSAGGLTVGALITGSGVSANTYVTAVVGGCTAVSSCTVSVSQTVASETLTAAPSVPFVSKWYCQPSGCPDASQGTAANQPQLVLSGWGPNNRPYLTGTDIGHFLTATLAGTIAQPWMISAVAGRLAGGGYRMFGGSSGAGGVLYFPDPGTSGLFAGGAFGAPASDATLHAFVGVGNGASSIIRVDSTETTGNPGTGAIDISNYVAQGTNQTEAIVWQLLPSLAMRAAIQANQKAYYGTP